MKKIRRSLRRRLLRRGLPLVMGLTSCGQQAQGSQITLADSKPLMIKKRRSPSQDPDQSLAQKAGHTEGFSTDNEHQPEALDEFEPVPWESDWIAQVEMPVRWDDSDKITGGEGTFVYMLRVQRTGEAGRPFDTYRLCNVWTPQFHTTGIWALKDEEVHQFVFHLDFFDSDESPEVRVPATSPGWEPGSTFDTDTFALTLGVDMPDPTHFWPRKAQDLAGRSLVDADQDGYPGVSLYARSQRDPLSNVEYKRPLVNLWQARAFTYHIAARVVMSLHVRFDASNNAAQGFAYVPISPQGEIAVNMRVLGCTHDEGRSLCSVDDAKTADENLLVYRPAGEPRVHMRQIKRATATGPAPTCFQVRQQIHEMRAEHGWKEAI